MSTEYTPTEAEVEEWAGVGWFAMGRADLPAECVEPFGEIRRGIARIKAEAKAEGLREAALHIGRHGSGDGQVWHDGGGFHDEDYLDIPDYLRMVADQIEKEARDD